MSTPISDLCYNLKMNLIQLKKLKPNKRLGQNFLVSDIILEKIIKSSQIKSSDTILEIGPGTGVLTKALAEKAKKVIAVEKDKRLAGTLKEELTNKIKNVEIIQGDILKIQSLKLKKYKLIANLPYYITAPVIRMFLENNPPELMVLMVQKEVGQRICASPPKMSKIAVFSQFYGKPEIISNVSKEYFYPKPKVDSAILKIAPFNNLDKKIDRNLFSKIVKAGFSQPRKQLINNLSKSLDIKKQETEDWLKKNNIEPRQRAETLNVKEH
jgi:16S rRNA (adenine1518-N6/adenine1519-N6)-dimethyltransferase